MPETFSVIDEVAQNIESKLSADSNKKKMVLLYAFNGSGKTRLSTALEHITTQEGDSERMRVLSYNAYFEDIFHWNNDESRLYIETHNEIVNLIREQGLENEIADNFQKLTHSRIYPTFALDDGFITFGFAAGDDRTEVNIKISRGEESIFIWSVFYTVLSAAFLALDSEEDNRETALFNSLDLVVIDDPVSSIDDTRIIAVATELVQLINSSSSRNVRFLITTHHALFFNLFHNEYNRGRNDVKLHSLLLTRNASDYILNQQDDSPFAYHLVIRDEIQTAISSGNLKKYHFNLFRGILEKTANFFGYGNWRDCLEESDKAEIARLINTYSHGKLSDLESPHFPEEHKVVFARAFTSFINRCMPLRVAESGAAEAGSS